MPRKSNKTSYVMNLITNGEPENQEQVQSAEQEKAEQESGQEQGTAQPAAAQSREHGAAGGTEPDNKNVVVVDEAGTTDKISEAIKQQLEISLEEQEKEEAQEDAAQGGNSSIMQDNHLVPETETEPKAAASGDAKMSDEEIQKMIASMQAGEPGPEQAEPVAAEPEPEAETPAPAAATSTDAKMSDEEIQKMIAGMQAGEPGPEQVEPVAAEPEPEAETPAPAAATSTDAKMSDEEIQKMIAGMQAGEPEPAEEEEEKPYRTVNVMEAIVGRVDLEKHMKDYDVCLCGRCRADVRALMLTRLPSKYVVMNDTSVNPMLNYYEGKFKIRVYTEILRACMEVKDHPRHKNMTVR